MRSLFILVVIGLFSGVVFAQDDGGLFPTVGVYLACKNKQVSEFDNDFSEDRVKPKKCGLQYPKYCNDARMAMMEDCVRCADVACPSGTYCDQKRRKCKKGTPPPVQEVQVVAPPPVVQRFTVLPERVTVKSSVEHLAQQLPVVIVAPSADDAAAQYLGVSLQSAGAQVMYDSNTDVDPAIYPDYQLVVVGGPCANQLWQKFSDETCENWDFRRKGVIKAKKLDGRLAIMVAGSTLQDTFALANILVGKYKSDPQFGAEKVLI